MNEIIRIMRLVEYIGPRDLVEEQVRRSLHGEKSIADRFGIRNSSRAGLVVIRATTLGEFPDHYSAEFVNENRKDADRDPSASD